MFSTGDSLTNENNQKFVVLTVECAQAFFNHSSFNLWEVSRTSHYEVFACIKEGTGDMVSM